MAGRRAARLQACASVRDARQGFIFARMSCATVFAAKISGGLSSPANFACSPVPIWMATLFFAHVQMWWAMFGLASVHLYQPDTT